MHAMTDGARRLLMEGFKVLSRIEANGVRVNTDYLDGTTELTKRKVAEVTDRIRASEVWRLWRKKFGDKASLGSREQLGKILYDEMGYEPVEYTEKTADLEDEYRRPKVSKDTIDEIELPFVADYILLEHLNKTTSTYLVGMRREMVRHGDGFYYLHPIYNLHTVSTFRSSCDHPNFQNFPKRNPEMAELIRPCFQPHPGHMLAEIDFGQIEVRIAAVYTKDPVLMKYVRGQGDMHEDSAMELFCLRKEDVWKKTTRDSAKNQWVFPQFYGSTYFNCAKNIWKSMGQRDFRVGESGRRMVEHLKAKGIHSRGRCVPGTEPEKGTFEYHCREIERSFWQKRFKVYTAWKRSWYEEYERTGGFTMLSGFAVNGYFKKNDVCNYPVQGSAFHCLLWVLIELQAWLDRYRMRTRIVGEIHDSLLLSVHPKELQDVLSKCRELMTKAILKAWKWITVPLDTESDVGPVDGHWMQCKLWEEKNGMWGAAA